MKSLIFFLGISFVNNLFALGDSDITENTADFSKPEPYEEYPAGSATHEKVINSDAFSFPSANMRFDRQLQFAIGNRLFTRNWVSVSSSKSGGGVGPLFNARSCQSCHFKDGRGHLPNSDDDDSVSLILKLKTDQGLGDKVYGNQFQDFSVEGVSSEGKVHVSYQTSKVLLADGAEVELRKPVFELNNLGYGIIGRNVHLLPRIAPQMIGLGLIEAIHEQDIVANEQNQQKNNNAVSGRVSNVEHQGRKSIGRFGWKAEATSLSHQSSIAFFNDMGLSSSAFQNNAGDCTDLQTSCKKLISKSGLPEINDDLLASVVFYVRNLSVPKRREAGSADVLKGKELFYKSGCASCHRPKYITKKSKQHTEQSRQLIWPYTDLLLHDMGTGLADPSNGGEYAREWRTPPLWGIGLTPVVNQEYGFLHDGRARTVLEAILWHGGEAQAARDQVIGLSTEQRKHLLLFVNSL